MCLDVASFAPPGHTSSYRYAQFLLAPGAKVGECGVYAAALERKAPAGRCL